MTPCSSNHSGGKCTEALQSYFLDTLSNTTLIIIFLIKISSFLSIFIATTLTHGFTISCLNVFLVHWSPSLPSQELPCHPQQTSHSSKGLYWGINLICLPQTSVAPGSQETLRYPVPTLGSSLSCQLPEFQKDLRLPLPFQPLSRRSTCALTHTLLFKTPWELLLFQEVVLELSSGCLACGLFRGEAWYTFYLQITTSPSRLQTPWEQRWDFIHLPSIGAPWDPGAMD